MLKGQDIVVLSVIMDSRFSGVPYAELGCRACLSVSETHAAVRRLREAALIGSERRLLKRNVIEFLVHGLRYVFPFRQTGIMARGIPTAFAAPVAEGVFAVAGVCPVWRLADGDTIGLAVEPLYETVPNAAAKDQGVYDRLAVIDMLRGGRLRERQFAEGKIKEMIAQH
ncbi:MAG: hypothetical protein J6U40_14330 [Kiritimatiellae bacterium]|nr:hypothetical protein [Kiritimatiellia bacterium]MBP5321933.1 hypothetical protein [Kiritimatiellia bacterium]